MKTAPLYAGLAFNLLFFESLFQAAPIIPAAQLWVAALLLGLFLYYGTYYAPVLSGRGLRETVATQFGSGAAFFFWWIVLPFWAIAFFQFHAQFFGTLAHTPAVRDPLWYVISDDDRRAGYWAWIALTSLAAVHPWASLPRTSYGLALLSAGILLAAPFAYSPPLPEALYLTPYCCSDPSRLESAVVLWFTPALLLARNWETGSKPTVRIALLLVAFLVLSVAAVKMTFNDAALDRNPLLKVGSYLRLAVGSMYPRVLLAVLTLLVAGRLCLSLLAERLGPYRRWWTVLPLALCLIAIPIDISLLWPHAAAFCLPLAGVLTAARNQPIPNQPIAYLAYLAGLTVSIVYFLLHGGGYYNIYTAPFLSWLTAFLVFTACKNLRLPGVVYGGP